MKYVLYLTCALGVMYGCSAFRGSEGALSSADVNAAKAQAFDSIEREDYHSAIAILTPIATKGIKDSQVYAMLGKAHWKTGDLDVATKNYEQSIRLDYSNAVAHLDFAEMLMEHGKIGRALTEFELAVRFGQSDPLTHHNYGLALYEFGRREEALGQWQIAFSMEGSNPLYAEAMGIGLSGVDDRTALEYFEIASENGADSPKFHNNYGLLLQRLGRYEVARLEFDRARVLDPHNETYEFNLALLLLTKQDFEPAIPVLENLVESAPHDRTRRIYLGRAHYEIGNFQEAIDVLEPWLGTWASAPKDRRRSKKKAPGLDEAYDIVAMSHRGTGELVKALVYIEKATDLAPDDVVHLNNYGVILAESGRIDEAKVQWGKVLTLEPNNPVAKQNISAFER